jgi:hypothetical protein
MAIRGDDHRTLQWLTHHHDLHVMSAHVLYQYYSSTFVSLTLNYFQQISADNYHDVIEKFVLPFNYDHEQNYHLSQRTAHSQYQTQLTPTHNSLSTFKTPTHFPF